MRGTLPISATGRAIIGVIALYALLLQSFAAAAKPPAYADAAGVICAAAHGSDAPSGDAPLAHDHPCCTAAQTSHAALPPLPWAAAARPASPPAAIVWRPEADLPRTGPPTRSHSARGPPAA